MSVSPKAPAALDVALSIMKFRFFVLGFRGCHRDGLFCSSEVLLHGFKAAFDECANKTVAARVCLLRGAIQFADQTGCSMNR